MRLHEGRAQPSKRGCHANDRHQAGPGRLVERDHGDAGSFDLAGQTPARSDGEDVLCYSARREGPGDSAQEDLAAADVEVVDDVDDVQSLSQRERK
jgi:hypothetical protein